MIKRDTTETIYEYDKEGKLIKKTVTETHEEEEGTTLTYPYPTNPCSPSTGTPNNDWWRQPYITWNNTNPLTATLTQDISGSVNTTTTTHN